MRFSALAKDLEMMGRSGLDRTKEGAEKLRVLAPASSRSPLKRERAIYLQYLQYGHACQ